MTNAKKSSRQYLKSLEKHWTKSTTSLELSDCCSNEVSITYLTQILFVLLGEDLLPRQIIARNGLVDVILSMISNFINQQSKEEPPWLACALGILDALAQLPIPPVKDMKSETQPPSLEIRPYLSSDQLQMVLKMAVGLLRVPLKNTAPLLLLCSRLTRNIELATLFLQHGGVELLLQLHTTPSPNMGFVNAIIRHLIEDPATLQASMETEIISSVTSMTQRPGTRVPPKALLTTLAAVVCRDPAIFMQAAVHTCRMATTPQPSICLAESVAKPTAPVTPATTAPTTTTTTTTTTTATATIPQTATPERAKPTKLRTPPNLKQVVLALLDCLVQPSTVQEPETKEKKEGEAPPSEPLSAVQLLQMLSDIIVSYAGCSHLILRHQLGKNSKHSNVINFVLRELLPYSHAAYYRSNNQLNNKLQAQNQMAMKFLAALCSRADGRRKVITELIAVLDEQVNSLKTNPNAIHAIHCIGELIYLLLTSRTGSGVSVTVEMAKMMQELELTKILSSAIHATDLYRPDAYDIVNNLLKPLDVLTRATVSTAKPKEEGATTETTTTAMQTTDVVDEIVLNPHSDISYEMEQDELNAEEGL